MSYPDKAIHFDQVCKFVIKLARAAHTNGVQSRRLEHYLDVTTKSLGYSGVFRANPNEVHLNFVSDDKVGHISYTIYMEKTDIHLIAIDQLGLLVSKLLNNEIDLKDASQQLDEINQASSQIYNKTVTAAGYALTSLGFAWYLGCSPMSVVAASILGILTYIIALLGNRFSEFSYALSFITALIIGLLSATLSLFFSGIDVYFVALSALIYLVPGFTISSGIIEISYQYIVSGMINLINGLVALAILFFGVFFSVSIIQHISSITISLPQHQGHFIFLPLIILAVGICIIFQIPKKYILWAMLCVICACIGISIGRLLGDNNIGNVLGCMFSVLFANFYSKKFKHSTLLILIPSLVFLVSGSIGFRGFIALSSDNFSAGYHDVMQMFIVAVTLAIGLGIGNGLYKNKVGL